MAELRLSQMLRDWRTGPAQSRPTSLQWTEGGKLDRILDPWLGAFLDGIFSKAQTICKGASWATICALTLPELEVRLKQMTIDPTTRGSLLLLVATLRRDLGDLDGSLRLVARAYETEGRSDEILFDSVQRLSEQDAAVYAADLPLFDVDRKLSEIPGFANYNKVVCRYDRLCTFEEICSPKHPELQKLDESIQSIQTSFSKLAREQIQPALPRLLRHMHIESNILEGVFALRELLPFCCSAAEFFADDETISKLVRAGFLAEAVEERTIKGQWGKVADRDKIIRILQANDKAYSHLYNIRHDLISLSTAFINNLHSILMEETKIEELPGKDYAYLNIGAFRRGAAFTNSSENYRDLILFASPLKLESLMEEFVLESRRLLESVKSGDLSPYLASLWMHYAFVTIHPYEDGNGRVARLLACLPFVFHQQTPFIVLSQMKLAYLNSFTKVDKRIEAETTADLPPLSTPEKSVLKPITNALSKSAIIPRRRLSTIMPKRRNSSLL